MFDEIAMILSLSLFVFPQAPRPTLNQVPYTYVHVSRQLLCLRTMQHLHDQCETASRQGQYPRG